MTDPDPSPECLSERIARAIANIDRMIAAIDRACIRPEPDFYLRTKVCDLLHLLAFADIKTPTPGDADQARTILASLHIHMRQLREEQA